MDNPFENLDYKRWFNMIAVASFLVFFVSLTCALGIYEIQDVAFAKQMMSYSSALFFISVGEIANHQITKTYEQGELHQINPLTGESWGHIPNVKKAVKKEIRKWHTPGVVLYLIGLTCFIAPLL
ncbi:hypothetical protein CRU96_05800 [Malaciobacter halophilus]|nr:hypothetical protein [Malaciobacter halophilus]RYA23921.1 hypothetical protein CRU96_05800 [Malaciobacter halophilus]